MRVDQSCNPQHNNHRDNQRDDREGVKAANIFFPLTILLLSILLRDVDATLVPRFEQAYLLSSMR